MEWGVPRVCTPPSSMLSAVISTSFYLLGHLPHARLLLPYTCPGTPHLHPCVGFYDLLPHFATEGNEGVEEKVTHTHTHTYIHTHVCTREACYRHHPLHTLITSSDLCKRERTVRALHTPLSTGTSAFFTYAQEQQCIEMNPEARQMAIWERLRNEARQADQLIDQQLLKLEALAIFDEEKVFKSADASSSVKGVSTSGSVTPASMVSFEDVESQYRGAEREIDESLRQLEQTVLGMEDICRELGPTSAAARHTERFRGMLAEKQQTRRRLSMEFRQRKDRYELAASRMAGDARRRGGPADDNARGGVRILIDEQMAIQHTLNRVNGLLEQAEGTRDRLRMQRERFNQIGDKVLHIAEHIPFVQNLVRRIDMRRRREVVVLSTVLSSLMFIFFFFL
ncbi:golgi SNARE protein-like protein [Leishmania tarentolae]|uniref:Golgi SNARE protein-like protein n=1 Tax=Leishmania tarentolae TaxID=5689 RepID=A0A640KV94_LEITA|nr:golgi SNARE protein-like protein [Leishmania tarentolae]